MNISPRTAEYRSCASRRRLRMLFLAVNLMGESCRARCGCVRVCVSVCMYVCMYVPGMYGGRYLVYAYVFVRACVSSMGSKNKATQRPQQTRTEIGGSSQLQSRDWVNAGAEEWRVRREDGEKRQMVGRNGKVFPTTQAKAEKRLKLGTGALWWPR